MEHRSKELVMKANPVKPPALNEEVEETPANEKSSSARTASKEEFEKAQAKTSKLHAGLFRRLAK